VKVKKDESILLEGEEAAHFLFVLAFMVITRDEEHYYRETVNDLVDQLISALKDAGFDSYVRGIIRSLGTATERDRLMGVLMEQGGCGYLPPWKDD